jgi:hypothetical protein
MSRSIWLRTFLLFGGWRKEKQGREKWWVRQLEILTRGARKDFNFLIFGTVPMIPKILRTTKMDPAKAKESASTNLHSQFSFCQLYFTKISSFISLAALEIAFENPQTHPEASLGLSVGDQERGLNFTILTCEFQTQIQSCFIFSNSSVAEYQKAEASGFKHFQLLEAVCHLNFVFGVPSDTSRC